MRSALGELRVEGVSGSVGPQGAENISNAATAAEISAGESPDVQLSGLQRPDILGASYTAVGPVE